MAGRGPRQGATMTAVAERAGVSITTVSHVMNLTRPVAAATAALVLEAAVEVGYVSDAVRSLRNADLRTVGLAMSAISNPYFAAVVHSIERRLSRDGYSLLLADTHDEQAVEMRAVLQLLRQHVDAIILAPVADPTKILGYTAKQDIPVVVIDRPVASDVDQVTAENIESTAQLVEHLADLGHERIAMISGRKGLTTTTEREDGYRLGLRRRNLPYRRELHVDGDSTPEGAAAALHHLLSLAPRPTAAVVGNNSMTIGFLRAAKDIGVRIPEDMALVCFDDFEWADLFRPGLTAIAQPTDAIGMHAADLVLSRIAHPELPGRRVQLKSTFVHRESCGCSVACAPDLVAGDGSAPTHGLRSTTEGGEHDT